jgi:hypothetical protein
MARNAQDLQDELLGLISTQDVEDLLLFEELKDLIEHVAAGMIGHNTLSVKPTPGWPNHRGACADSGGWW